MLHWEFGHLCESLMKVIFQPQAKALPVLFLTRILVSIYWQTRPGIQSHLCFPSSCTSEERWGYISLTQSSKLSIVWYLVTSYGVMYFIRLNVIVIFTWVLYSVVFMKKENVFSHINTIQWSRIVSVYNADLQNYCLNWNAKLALGCHR